jgi:hypothetical protein
MNYEDEYEPDPEMEDLEDDEIPDPDRCPKCGEDVTMHFGSLRQICPLPIADND